MHPSKSSDCVGCPLAETGGAFVPYEGLGSLGVGVVGEAPGEAEDKDRLPFRPYAPSGAILERVIKRIGTNRSQYTVFNTVSCRPPRNFLEHAPYEIEAINHCKVHFRRVIDAQAPKVLLALGNVALRTLTGFGGAKQTISHVRGFYLNNLEYPSIPVISSYHPAAISRDKPNLIGVLQADILRAKVLAQAGGKFTRPERRYTLFPPIDLVWFWIEELRKHPELLVTYDIETVESITGTSEDDLRVLPDGRVEWTQVKPEYQEVPEHLLAEMLPEKEDQAIEQVVISTTRITQIQFSCRENEAIVLPFEGDYIQAARAILSLPNDKMAHNGRLFDRPLLRQAWVYITGREDDSMDAWHSLQADLPKGLQYVTSFYIPEAEPWKHTAQVDGGLYGGDDVAHLRKFGPKILEQLKERGLWYSYDRQVRQLGYVLDRATDLGIPVNDQKRMALDAEVAVAQQAVGQEIQGLVPDHLRNCEPKNGYVNPKMALKRMAQGPLEDGEVWARRWFDGPEKGKTVRSNTPLSSGGTASSEGIEGFGDPNCRWVRLQPFLPNSSQQILRWIKWRREEDIQTRIRGYLAQPRYQASSIADLRAMAERTTLWTIPKAFREDKETTAKKELQRLGQKTKDKFFDRIIEYREYAKIRSTYVNGWKPAADGRIHSVFKFAPATGQLSSSNPNCQNLPSPKGPEGSNSRRIAEAIHRMVEAPPGFKIVTFDYKAFHVLTTGFEARCAPWMRLARLDMHSFVTGMFIGEPWEKWLDLPDEELAEILSRIKNQSTPRYEQLQTTFIRDRKAKPADLAIGFGARERKIYDLNQESFANLGEVKKFFSLLRNLGKEVFQWQDKVRFECHQTNKGFLKTAYSYMRWFHDVYRWNSAKGGLEPGKDHEAVVAYRPANDAFGIKKDVELLLGDQGLDVKYGFANDIHDELFFVCPDEHVEECLHTVKPMMEAPSRFLVDPILAPEGLWCEVETKVGQNWGTPGKDNPGGMQKVKINVPRTITQ